MKKKPLPQISVPAFTACVIFACLFGDALPAQTELPTGIGVAQMDKLYFPSPDGQWESTDISQIGWDQSKLDKAMDFAEGQKSSAMLILHRGKIVAEKHWQPKATFKYRKMKAGVTAQGHALEDVASIQKSVAATLLGVALDKKIVSLDDLVQKHLGNSWSNADREAEAKIKVKHIVSMTTGLNDQLEYAAAAGTKWQYNSAAYSRIMNILEAASGQDRNQLTKQWLGPLGMNDSRWEVRKFARDDPKANRHGFVTSARDLGRFGLMVLNQGKWDGIPIVANQNYIKEMTSPSQELNPAYGYLWWLNGQPHSIGASGFRKRGPLIPQAPKDLFAGLGALGRKVYIAPSHQLVVVRLGDAPEKKFDEQFWELLMDAMPKKKR